MYWILTQREKQTYSFHLISMLQMGAWETKWSKVRKTITVTSLKEAKTKHQKRFDYDSAKCGSIKAKSRIIGKTKTYI